MNHLQMHQILSHWSLAQVLKFSFLHVEAKESKQKKGKMVISIGEREAWDSDVEKENHSKSETHVAYNISPVGCNFTILGEVDRWSITSISTWWHRSWRLLLIAFPERRNLRQLFLSWSIRSLKYEGPLNQHGQVALERVSAQFGLNPHFKEAFEHEDRVLV